MADLIWIVIALPLAGSAFLHFWGRRLSEPRAGYVATAAVAGSFAFALTAALPFFSGTGEATTTVVWEWMPALGASFEFLWDPLAALMTLVVTGVGTLIHLYSIGYMHGDERYSRFFAYLNLFAASMLTLVLAGNFSVLFMGWELVGLCSYLLISFWWSRPAAAAAGKKAFVVNRIGDLGFTVALMIIFASFGTLSYGGVLERPGSGLSAGTATAVALLLLVGAAGKSAQIPLYVWLPDAMEGPTPVSALIHAATMVTAGVYLVARMAPIFELSSSASAAVAIVGAATALLAATIAIAQNDIKRVLAYSTISQLGYMFMAVGASAYVAGIFHLTTHSFFKALLFLGAGSVIHALGEEQDMRKMGGLWKRMPVTGFTMAVATLAIAGIFPLAGFWSKDEILAVTFAAGGWSLALWLVGVITALLTAFYMTRQFVLVFLGEPRWAQGADPHESPRTMTVPLVVLAVLSVVGGMVNTPVRTSLEHFLEPAFESVSQAHAVEGSLVWILAGVSLLAGLGGIVLGGVVYLGRPQFRERLLARAARPLAAMEAAYRVDDLYGRLIVLPGKRLAGWLADVFDLKGIDGAVNGVARGIKRMGEKSRGVQTGFVRTYGLGFAAGSVALVIWFLAEGL